MSEAACRVCRRVIYAPIFLSIIVLGTALYLRHVVQILLLCSYYTYHTDRLGWGSGTTTKLEHRFRSLRTNASANRIMLGEWHRMKKRQNRCPDAGFRCHTGLDIKKGIKWYISKYYWLVWLVFVKRSCAPLSKLKARLRGGGIWSEYSELRSRQTKRGSVIDLW